MGVAPLEQRTTPDAVVALLRKEILTGDLAPGTQLREVQIAGDLGISRAPLREALATLEEEGLVERIPFRGAFVREVGHRKIDEISSIRRVLEPYAIELGLEELRTTHVKSMKVMGRELRAAAKAQDVSGAIDAHLRLHRQFYEAAGNSVLLDMWNSWESQLRLFLAEDLRRFRDPMVMAHDHDRLIDLIEAGDLDGIKHELLDHVHGYPPEAGPTN